MNLLWQQKLCNLQQLKIAIFTYHSPRFCFPWSRPCDYHAVCCMDGKTIQCLPNPSQYVPIYLQYFPSYTMLKSMRKSKTRYFYHIFVSPGDAPHAITLNVVWMEREFDAYKLSRCMCPSHYNRFWDTARYLWKNRHFIIPLAFDAPLRGVPVGIPASPLIWKTRMVSLPDGEKISKTCLFVLTWSTNVTDGRTLHDSKDRACIASRGKNKQGRSLRVET